MSEKSAYARGMEYYHYQHDGDYVFLGHTHESWEINILSRGEMEITYSGEVLTLRAGMLLLVEPNVYHRSRVISREGAEMTVYQFYTEDLPVVGHARSYQMDEYLHCLMTLIAHECAEKTDDEKTINLRAGHTAEQLLAILLQRLTREESRSVSSSDPDAVLFREAIAYMEKNLHRSLCIEEIVRICCTNATKLKSIFAIYTGTGIMAHYSAMRLERAKEYLRSGYSVGDVSTQLGYSSQAYFSLCFKKGTGESPRQFKAKQIKADD